MDLRKLKTLIDLVQQSGIAELEITEGEEKVRISRGGTPQHAAPQAPVYVTAPPLQPQPEAAAAPAEKAAPAEPEGHVVKSPMVGTFYRSPEPGAEPYVKAGSRVAPGQTLCIIEAMKIMNEIESEVSGTIRELLVEDATPVEFGQVLYRVEPNA